MKALWIEKQTSDSPPEFILETFGGDFSYTSHKEVLDDPGCVYSSPVLVVIAETLEWDKSSVDNLRKSLEQDVGLKIGSSWSLVGYKRDLATAYIKAYGIESLPVAIIQWDPKGTRVSNKFERIFKTVNRYTHIATLKDAEPISAYLKGVGSIEQSVASLELDDAKELILKHRLEMEKQRDGYSLEDVPTNAEHVARVIKMAKDHLIRQEYKEALSQLNYADAIMPGDESVTALLARVENDALRHFKDRVDSAEVATYNLRTLGSIAMDLGALLPVVSNSEFKKLHKKASKNYDSMTKRKEKEERLAVKKQQQAERRRIKEEDKILSKVQTYKQRCQKANVLHNRESERQKKAAAKGNVRAVEAAQKSLQRASKNFTEASINVQKVIDIYRRRGLGDAAYAVYKEVNSYCDVDW